MISALTESGGTFQKAALSQIYRNRVDTRSASLVVGSMDFVRAALRQQGIQMPVIESYPALLHGYLHRNVWRARLREAVSLSLNGNRVFVKPSKRPKLFTGFVLDYSNAYLATGAPPSEPVWCSEPVCWESEWRAYVVDGSVLYLAHYDGNRDAIPDSEMISSAVRAMSDERDSPCSYAIDFGVLSTGNTALIEANDAFAVGAYDNIPGDIYLKMLQTRWTQLSASAGHQGALVCR